MPVATASAQEAAAPAGGTHPLAVGVREMSLAASQDTLVELSTLRQAAHQPHWNVVGIEATSNDMPTQDLLIGIAFTVDKQAGMPCAHLDGA